MRKYTKDGETIIVETTIKETFTKDGLKAKYKELTDSVTICNQMLKNNIVKIAEGKRNIKQIEEHLAKVQGDLTEFREKMKEMGYEDVIDTVAPEKAPDQ